MRLLPVLVAALLLTGCTPAPPEPGAAAVRAPADVCHTPELGDTGLWVEADGNRFEAGAVGDESTTAVLVHQSGANYCGWARFVHLLRENGIRAVLLNLCGSGQTECTSEEHLVETGAAAVLGAADWARANGAGRVVVVGASLGGIVAIAAAGTDDDGVIDAIVDLSGPIAFEGASSSAFASGVSVPVYFAVSPTDTVVTVDQFENLSALMTSETVQVYPDGVGHGWDMLFDQTLAPSELALEVVAFIQG